MFFLYSLLLFFSIINYSFSQDTIIKGVIINENGEPCPYINVAVLKNVYFKSYGTFTNEKGEFSLKVKKGDTLKISGIGYESLNIPVLSLKDTIVIKEEPIVFSEVIISSILFDERILIDYCKNRETLDFLVLRSGEQYGLFYECSELSKLIKVRLPIIKEGNCEGLLRIRILSIDSLGKPDRDLLDNKYININEVKGDMSIDLSSDSVYVKPPGFFVVMDFVDINLPEGGKLGFRIAIKSKKRVFWLNYRDVKWHLITKVTTSLLTRKYIVPCIVVELLQ